MPKNLRFLIIRLSSIGDVLHCTPVARMLKTSLPSCHITWVVGQVPADMLRYNPYIDELYVWPREQWEQALRRGRFGQAWQLWQELKLSLTARQFDIALDIHGLFISGMVAIASNASRRIGMSNTREFNSLFMTETAPPDPGALHVIQRYLSVLRPLNIITTDYRMTLAIPPQAAEFAGRFFSEHNIKPGDKLIAVNPATTWPAKNWPPEYFAAVIRELHNEAQILLCGAPADRPIADIIKKTAQVPVLDTVGRTTLLEMAALLARANLLVVGDTGPLHMAIALGTPTVSIFGATDPRRFGPLDLGHIVLQGRTDCAPCHKTVCSNQDIRCLRSVSPDKVIACVRALLNK